MEDNWPYKMLQVQKATWFGNQRSSAKTQTGIASWEARKQMVPSLGSPHDCQLATNKPGPQQSHGAGYSTQPHPWGSTSAFARAPKDQAPRKRPARYPRAPAMWHASRHKGQI